MQNHLIKDWAEDFDREVLNFPALLDAAQMQAVDQCAVAQGMDSFALMKNAAKGICDHVMQLLLDDGHHLSNAPILVLAGPGNNGGDGLVAASLLRAQGCKVSVLRVGPDAIGDSDAEKARTLWNAEELSLESTSLNTKLDEAAIIIDALFGAGLSRALDAPLAELVRAVNSASAKVVAVDVPSGLDGNSNQAFEPSIRAHSTITFFRFKPAHVMYPGRVLCGQKHLVQIGLTDAQCDSASAPCFYNSPGIFSKALPEPGSTQHKYERGHVLVRGGPLHATGAARLSAGTAIYCGSGLVTLACRKSALAVNAAHLTAVMLSECNDAEGWLKIVSDKRINTLLVGPGNGVDDETRNAVLLALQANKACVLDADALSCWEGQSDVIVPRMAAMQAPLVLTPHSGEFNRLFGSDSIQALPSRLHQARAAAQLCSAIVILKGADTIIASADGRASVNANAPPWLATAGAGDVLAGLVSALLAQGMPAFEASCAAVWLHGCAATHLGYPLCAEQLVEQTARELGELVGSSWSH